jgi:hypothetical protein
MMDDLFRAEGQNGQVELLADKLVIKRKGIRSLLNHGLNGDKTIFLASLRAVQLKEANWIAPGYIQFSISGGSESVGGYAEAVHDENTVTFAKTRQPAFLELRQRIEDQQRRGAPLAASSSAPVGELERLVALRDKGAITPQEFEVLKRKILGLP